MCRLPVSALQHNIVAEIERLAAVNTIDIRQTANARLVHPEIDLICDKVAPHGPYADLCSRKVVFYESHLAFLWAYIYSYLVIYEECIQAPMMRGVFDGEIKYDSPLTIRAKDLQEWALGFANGYSAWDEHALPNPKLHRDAAEKVMCEKANRVYLTAISFLFFHEYAHLTLGHQSSEDDKSWSIEQEKDADNYAMACIAHECSTEQDRHIVGLSSVLLCASNLFLPKDFRGIRQIAHPHLHDRLRNGIVALNLQEEKSKFYLFYLGSMSLRDYLSARGLSVPQLVCDTAEELFYELLNTIDDLLQTTG